MIKESVFKKYAAPAIEIIFWEKVDVIAGSFDGIEDDLSPGGWGGVEDELIVGP